MPKKINHQQYLEKLIIKGIKVKPLEEYINDSTKILHICSCGITEWQVSPRSVLSGHECKICGKIKNMIGAEIGLDRYIERLKVIKSDVEYSSGYVNITTKCKHICKCGNPWEVKPYHVLRGVHCKNCGKLTFSEKIIRSDEEYLLELKLKNINVIPLEKYLGRKEKILHKCVCTNEWKVSPGSVLGGHLCPICGIEIQKKSSSKPEEEYILELLQIGCKVTLVSGYVNNSTKCLHECICGNKWPCLPSNVLNGHLCNKCQNKSRGNELIEKILNEIGILNIREHRFKDCRNKNPLPFDFYLPEEKVCIEYDGHYHYYREEIVQYTKLLNERFNNETIQKSKLRDSIKTQYCIDNNIKLIRIPFWEFKNIEQILRSELNL